MPTFFIASSADFFQKKIEAASLRSAKQAASKFFGVAGCGCLTVSAVICERTDRFRHIELARKYGRDKWQHEHFY